MTHHELALRRIEDALAALSSKMTSGPAVLSPDRQTVAHFHYLRFRYALLNGQIQMLQVIDESLDAAIASHTQASDLWLLKAQVALKRHRFRDAEKALSAEDTLHTCPLASLLLSDVDLQQGRYAEARARIEAVLSSETTWDGLARLAHITHLMGDLRSADNLYAAAADELSAKDMQSFAWLEVQRGWMHFQRGDHDQAMKHYCRADKAYSGYWLVTERKGELIGAQGRFEEASELYERLYRDAPRPEWAHALGDLYTLWGDLHTAQEWKLRAYSSYLQSVTAGEVYYLHCLADLCSELSGREPEAIEWARKDFALRSNFATQGHLAWAYYRGGYLEEAVDCVAAGLASAVISGRLYLQAACIYAAVSQMQLAGHYMRLAMAVNPRPPKANIALPRMTGPRSAA